MDRNRNEVNRNQQTRTETNLKIPFATKIQPDHHQHPAEDRFPDSPLDVLVQAYLEDPERWDGLA